MQNQTSRTAADAAEHQEKRQQHCDCAHHHGLSRVDLRKGGIRCVSIERGTSEDKVLRSREAESRAEGESYAAYDSLPQYRRSGVHTPTASAKVARTDEVVALSNLDDDACVGTVSRRTRRVSSPLRPPNQVQTSCAKNQERDRRRSILLLGGKRARAHPSAQGVLGGAEEERRHCATRHERPTFGLN